MSEKFELPQEVHDLFEKSTSAEACRDKAIASVFRASRAIYYDRKMRKYRLDAWLLIHELYPDEDRELTYSVHRKKLLLKNTDAT